MTTRRGEKEEFFQKIAPLTVQPSTMGMHKDIGSNSATLWQNGYVVRKIPYVFLFVSLFVSLFENESETVGFSPPETLTFYNT